MSLSDILTAVQQGVAAVNNLGMLLGNATINSSSIRVAINSTYFIPSSASSGFLPSSAATGGTVTQVNTGVGLTGGPITISGTLAVSLTTLTNSLASDVQLSTAAGAPYVNGPSVAQGSSGTWLASGSLTLVSNAVSNGFFKLWDGTTVIDSGNVIFAGGVVRTMVSLSGVITSPASNIKISVSNPDLSTGAFMEANRSGNGKDCTITVVRIG